MHSVAWAATPLSKYGNIQTVHNYSSNPFWTPDSPYNQRMPTPVYATGTDIETAECQRVVYNLIAAQCATMDNCVSTRLSDIRPTVIMMLSRLPGGNYSTACAGYMDTAFADYVRQYAHAGANFGNTTFPAATAPNPNISAQTGGTQFPDTQKPQWAINQEQRAQELKDLNASVNAPVAELNPTSFPTTYEDLSFSDRMANAQQGYAPYKNNSAYKQIKISSDTSSRTQSKTNTSTQTKNDIKKPELKNNETDSVQGEIVFYL